MLDLTEGNGLLNGFALLSFPPSPLFSPLPSLVSPLPPSLLALPDQRSSHSPTLCSDCSNQCMRAALEIMSCLSGCGTALVVTNILSRSLFRSASRDCVTAVTAAAALLLQRLLQFCLLPHVLQAHLFHVQAGRSGGGYIVKLPRTPIEFPSRFKSMIGHGSCSSRRFCFS